MLTPDELEGIPNEVVELFTELETSILEAIAKRVKRAGKVTESSEHQAMVAQEARALNTELKKLAKDYTPSIKEATQNAFIDSARKSLEADYKIFSNADKKLDKATLGKSALQRVKANLKATLGDLSRLTKTTCTEANKAFIAECNSAFMKQTSGAFSYQDAMQQACNNLANAGLVTVTYANSKPVKRTIESAVRANILTSINHTVGAITLDNCEALGADLVEVSAHQSARPEHALWQGKIYSLSGHSTKYPNFSICDYGSITGLCGINCRHSFYPYIEGRAPHYSQKQLNEIKSETVSFGGKELPRYEAEQKLRGMERKIRYYKREGSIANTMDLTDKKAFCDSKIKEWQGKREAFCKETGLHKDGAREWIGERGKSNNKVANTGGEGTILPNGTALDNLPKSYNNARRVVIDGAINSTKDADGGRCNNIAKGFGYDMNCQSCVPTFLARLQGASVTALPYFHGREIEDVSLHPNHAYIDKKTGNYPKYEVLAVKNANELLNELNKITQGGLYSFDFYFDKDNVAARHVVSVMKDKDNVLNIYDPQSSKWYLNDNAKKFIDNVLFNKNIYLLRIDNLQLNNKVKRYLMEAVNE